MAVDLFTPHDHPKSKMAHTLRRSLNNTFTNVTETLFPDTKELRDVNTKPLLRTGSEYATSLPLQMAFYFNSFYAPVWIISLIVMFTLKFGQLSTLYQVIVLAIYVLMAVVEVIRLITGNIGNLTENISLMAGSFLLTLIVQLPLILLLLFLEDTFIFPFERAVNMILGLFHLFEIIMGFFAIRNVSQHLANKYHQQEFQPSFDDLEYVDDIGASGEAHVLLDRKTR